MDKFICSIFFCTVILTLSAGDVFACTCMHNKGSAENAYQANSRIFSGKVISSVKSGIRNRKVKIGILNSWKGKLPETIIVSTAATGSMCGYGFKKGESYLVYADGRKLKDLSVSLCSRTTLLSNAAEDIEALDSLRKEVKPAPE